MAVVAAGGCRDGQPAEKTLGSGERDMIERRVRRYSKKVVDLPDDVTLRLVDLTPTDAPGLLQADLEIANGVGSRRVPLVISRNGRHLVQGRLADLTVDPYAAAMSQIALADRPTRGDEDAPVTLVAYVDFQCPFCARAYRTLLDSGLPSYGERVRLVVKHFPLAAVHPWAETAAIGAACVHELEPEAFWPLADRLFREQPLLDVDGVGDLLTAMAREAGVDGDLFARCVDGEAGSALVEADEEEGRRLGVRSTPTVFVNGRKLEGARPVEEFKAAIDTALWGASGTETAAFP